MFFQRPINQERRRDLTRAGGLVNLINECNAPENRIGPVLGKPEIVLVFVPSCQRFRPFATGIPPYRSLLPTVFPKKIGLPPTRQGWFCPPTIWNTKPQLIRLAFIAYTNAMSLSDPTHINEMQIGQPAWRMALLFPVQGSWTEKEYLAIEVSRQIEFDRGCVEVLDFPTKEHQRLVRFLFLLIESFASGRAFGEVFFAPIPVRLWDQKYREPDLVFIRQGRENIGRYPDGADIVPCRFQICCPIVCSRRYSDIQGFKRDFFGCYSFV